MTAADDERTVGMTSAVARLYVLAVLDEIEQATARYLFDIHQIKRKYDTELRAGEQRFALLRQMGDVQWPPSTRTPTVAYRP